MITRNYVAFWCSLVISTSYAMHNSNTFAAVWFVIAILNFILDLVYDR